MKNSFLLSIILSLLMFSCAGSKTNVANDKESAVSVLRSFNSAIETQDYDKALSVLKAPDGMPKEKIIEAIKSFREKREISEKGIDILMKEGKWGKLKELVGEEKAMAIVNRFGKEIELQNCYGLIYKEANAAFFWTGSTFEIIRCDDIGKLE